MKSRMKWVGHVARVEEIRSEHIILIGKPDGKTPLGRLRIDGKIILEWILGR
jgi:hypothetical protein